jgi:hypothetical protein
MVHLVIYAHNMQVPRSMAQGLKVQVLLNYEAKIATGLAILDSCY